MIQVKILNGNNIVTIESIGKAPIKTSSGLVFYSPIDLIAASIGSCVGKNIVIFFQHEKLDVFLLENIYVEFKDNKFVCKIVHSKSIPEETLKALETKLLHCEIVSNLQKAFDIVFNFTVSKISPEQLKKDKLTKPCCGGQ